ncbi:MAG: ribonuclease III [Clostridia bacterium]|nr:ribonuclease III [Clostridia bacterium]
MLEEVKNKFQEEFLAPNQYGALTLAYIGDCVYEMYVRSYLLSCGDQKVNSLHKKASKLVCAASQAAFYHKIEHLLDEEEAAAFHRGRNTKSQVPKNAVLSDYRLATGVESLLGFLYVSGKIERISELMAYLFSNEK